MCGKTSISTNQLLTCSHLEQAMQHTSMPLTTSAVKTKKINNYRKIGSRNHTTCNNKIRQQEISCNELKDVKV